MGGSWVSPHMLLIITYWAVNLGWLAYQWDFVIQKLCCSQKCFFFVTMLASKAQISVCWLLRLWVYPFLRANIVFSISWGTLHFWSMYHFIEPFCTESVSYVYCIPCCSLWLRHILVSILLLIFTLSSFPCAYEDEICFQSVPYSDLFDFCGLWKLIVLLMHGEKKWFLLWDHSWLGWAAESQKLLGAGDLLQKEIARFWVRELVWVGKWWCRTELTYGGSWGWSGWCITTKTIPKAT